jgi:predicted permease
MKRIKTIQLLLIVLFTVTVLMVPMAAGASIERTLPATSVETNAVFTVSMINSGGFGMFNETIPDGFTFVDSTLEGVDQDTQIGNVITFTLFDESSFDYTVIASSTFHFVR